MIRALLLIGLAGCGAAHDHAADPAGSGSAVAHERQTMNLDGKARDAAAHDQTRQFLDAELARDASGFRAWLDGDAIALDSFLHVARTASDSGHADLLTPGRARVLSEFASLEKGLAALPPPGPGRPRVPVLDLGDADAPPAERAEATRFVIRATDADHVENGAMRVLVLKQIERAAADPSLDSVVAERAAAGLFRVMEPSPLVRLYGRRIVPMLAAALRSSPSDSATLRQLARGVLGHDVSADTAAAAELETLWRASGPYLVVDDGALPPFPGLKPWLVIDDYAQFSGGEPMPANTDDPARAAWLKISAERRQTIAADSEHRRRADETAWRTWYDAQRKALGIP
ncbi:MAG TPA: hypothetical protein VGM88_21255 [Kofleriaceae bacterium]|jgi:hypothetical protein